MSEVETHYGKLRKVVIGEKYTIEQWCEEKCKEEGITKLETYYHSWLENFIDEFHEKYFIINKEEVWEVIEHIEADDSDIDIMIPNEDGTITFIQQFYNGGTCLSEVIEEGIIKLKNK
jgi:hypothetical protein